VITNVTTSDGHSVVRIKTDRMQKYCVNILQIKYAHIIGMPTFEKRGNQAKKKHVNERENKENDYLLD